MEPIDYLKNAVGLAMAPALPVMHTVGAPGMFAHTFLGNLRKHGPAKAFKKGVAGAIHMPDAMWGPEAYSELFGTDFFKDNLAGRGISHGLYGLVDPYSTYLGVPHGAMSWLKGNMIGGAGFGLGMEGLFGRPEDHAL